MSSSPSPEIKNAPRAALARVIKQEILKVDGVLGVCPRFTHRFGRVAGVNIQRRGGTLVAVKVWVSVVHDAGAVGVSQRVQVAVLDAVARASGETPARVIVVVGKFKMLRSPQSRGKGEMT